MTKSSTRTSVRAGALSASCFNSGMEVWLYDEANLKELKESGVIDTLLEDGEEEFQKKMKPILKKGMLVAYGMEGDGGVDIDIFVGEPLSKKELSSAYWLKPQKAFLNLPSGKLCVESNDCLRLSSEEATDKGAIVKVPPGNYLLTLYRLDWEEVERRDLKYEGPTEIIVLTTGAQAKPVSKPQAILPFERPANPAGDYTISGNEVNGQANFMDYWDTFMFSINSKGMAELGAKQGDLLFISAPSSGVETTVVYLVQEEHEKEYPKGLGSFIKRASNLEAPKRKTTEWGYAYLMNAQDTGGQEILFCRRNDAKVCIEDKSKKKWQQAKLTLLKS